MFSQSGIFVCNAACIRRGDQNSWRGDQNALRSRAVAHQEGNYWCTGDLTIVPRY